LFNENQFSDLFKEVTLSATKAEVVEYYQVQNT